MLDCAAMPEPTATPVTEAVPDPCAVAGIGVFDSGLGGLSVLRALRSRLPEAPLHYVADSAHAPYGDRSEAYIVERSHRVAEHLVSNGARLLVVACNTATAAAVAGLRARWPGMPIVGVEPGLKPAAAATRNGRIAVLATRSTLGSAKFQALLAQQGDGVTVLAQPCPGLVDLIERGPLDAPDLRALVAHYAEPLRGAQVDTVVLGCTHYPFVRPLIEAALGPQVQIIDTSDAVARRAAQLWAESRIVARHSPMVRLQTTGDADSLGRFASAWLDVACEVSAVTI